MNKTPSNVISRAVLTAVAGASLLFLSAETGSCASPQWVTWEVSAGGNGHQYLAVPGFAGLTWYQAYFEATQIDGGYLATITSPAENNFVFSLINSPQFFTGFNGSGPAIGGYQSAGSAEPNGGWRWVTEEAWGYTNWLPGSPDGGTSENFLEFFSGTLGSHTPAATWNDINGYDTNIGGYVVERISVVPEPASLSLLAGATVVGLVFRNRKASVK